MKYDVVIGHRGAAGLAMENTIEAFKKAKEIGVKWIETDVRITKDDFLVLSHNSYYGDDIIAHCTYEYLKQKKSNRMVEVETFIKMFNTDFNVNFEVKDYRAFHKLIYYIRRYSLEDKVLISSFNHVELLKTQQNYTDIEFAPIIASRPISIVDFLLPFKGRIKKIVADLDFCDELMISECNQNNIDVFLYNVRSINQLNNYITGKIKGVIVDKPNKF